MTISPLFGGAMYYALQHDKKNGGGFVGRGINRMDAITNCMAAMKYDAPKKEN